MHEKIMYWNQVFFFHLAQRILSNFQWWMNHLSWIYLIWWPLIFISIWFGDWVLCCWIVSEKHLFFHSQKTKIINNKKIPFCEITIEIKYLRVTNTRLELGIKKKKVKGEREYFVTVQLHFQVTYLITFSCWYKKMLIFEHLMVSRWPMTSLSSK